MITEYVYLKPNQKTGTKKTGRYLNATKQDIIIVDVNWNKYVFTSAGFKVKGHFRWQPCGPDRQSTRLIFIDEFKKSGYSRRPKKELING